jgi:ankyrin
LEVVQLLVQQGANKDKVKNSGVSPLSMAAEQGHLEITQYLVQQGADKDKARNHGVTPLYMAAQNGHYDVVRYLCEQYADVNCSRLDNGWTALHAAAHQGHIAIIGFLMKYAARSDVPDVNGKLPIIFATTEEVRQAIWDGEKGQRDHGFKRAVLDEPRSAAGAQRQQR